MALEAAVETEQTQRDFMIRIIGRLDGIKFKGNIPENYKPDHFDAWTQMEQIIYRAGLAEGAQASIGRGYMILDSIGTK